MHKNPQNFLVNPISSDDYPFSAQPDGKCFLKPSSLHGKYLAYQMKTFAMTDWQGSCGAVWGLIRNSCHLADRDVGSVPSRRCFANRNPRKLSPSSLPHCRRRLCNPTVLLQPHSSSRQPMLGRRLPFCLIAPTSRGALLECAAGGGDNCWRSFRLLFGAKAQTRFTHVNIVFDVAKTGVGFCYWF